MPSLSELDATGAFEPPLSDAERALVEHLHEGLASEWIVFVRPQIGIGTPAVAVLSPRRGVVLIGLADSASDKDEVINRLGRMRDELAFVLVPQLGEWLDRTRADGTMWVAAVSEEAVLDGQLDSAMLADIATSPAAFDPALVEAVERVLGDRWVEGHAPTSLNPNAQQRDLLIPTPGYHLIRGMAGSGKSLVLAYRAAAAARSGRRVLVATYNRTLVNYLDHLLDTVPIRYRRRLVTVAHFHAICDAIASQAGVHLPRPGDAGNTADTRAIFDEEWPSLALEALESGAADGEGYDACYIDDGQDFPDLWFRVIERLAREPREIVVTVDEAQNLYGRAPTYYPKLRASRDGWITYPLMKTPRLSDATRLVADRLREQMRLELPDDARSQPSTVPEREGRSRLWRVRSPAEAGATVISLVLTALRQDGLPASDIAILVPSRQVGAAITALLAEQGVDANHIFPLVPHTSEDGAAAGNRRAYASLVSSRKRSFTWDDPRVKVVTLHSFKGWEARRVICMLPGHPEPRELVAAYVGVTRSSEDLHVITIDDVVGLRQMVTDVKNVSVDDRLASRFQQLYDAADGVSTPFRRTPVTEDPGIEWRGLDVLPMSSARPQPAP